MPDDISTSLHAALQRYMSDLMDTIASDGLTALKQTLDDAGASERLKQYEVFSHVAGNTVVFEIVVDSSVVVATDVKTAAAIQKEMSKARQMVMKKVTKTFELGLEGPRRVVRDARMFQFDMRTSARDARTSARDARQSARDARSSIADATIEDPHGIDMTPDGKMSITLERSVNVKNSIMHLPKGAYQGIMGDFMDRLNQAISTNFSDKLNEIMSRHVT